MNTEKKIRIKRKNKNKGFKKKSTKIKQYKSESTNTKSPLSKLILHNYLNCKL